MTQNYLAHELGKKTRTKDVIVSDDITFEGMMLSKDVFAGLRRCGFLKPSPVQLKAIPLGRCGFDLLVEGKSGTGKTLVFGIIALEMIDVNLGLQVVIAAPTREIAIQISDVILALGYYFKGLNIAVVTGGTPIRKDIEMLSNPITPIHILVGSPGRLHYLLAEKAILKNSIKLLVLDEADKLMSGSFLNDINFIFNVSPKRKQIIATSATYTNDLRDYIIRYMNSPSSVRPDQSSVLLGIHQFITIVNHHNNTLKQIGIKFEELKKIFTSLPFNQCLVFCNYQARAKTVCDMLKKEKWPASYLCASQTQEERVSQLRNLQSFTCRILVATDLAARGLDAANIDLVVNFDLPYEIATYLHRIGRGGRYGSISNAVSIASTGKENRDFLKLLSTIGHELQIQNLWEGKKISLEPEDEPKINKSVVMAELGEGVLNMITETKAENGNHIEDFHELLLSMDKINVYDNEIDTFDNICESLNEFQEIDNAEDPLDKHTPSIELVKSDEIFDFIESVINPSRMVLVTNKSEEPSEITHEKRFIHKKPQIATKYAQINETDTESELTSSSDSTESSDCEDDNVVDHNKLLQDYKTWKFHLSIQTEFIRQAIFIRELTRWK